MGKNSVDLYDKELRKKGWRYTTTSAPTAAAAFYSRDHHSCQHQFSPLPAQNIRSLLYAALHHLHCHSSCAWGMLVFTPSQDKANSLLAPQEPCSVSYPFSFSVFSFSFWTNSFPLKYKLKSLQYGGKKVEIRNGKRTKKLLECPLFPKVKTAWVSITLPTMDIKIQVNHSFIYSTNIYLVPTMI